MLFLTRWFGVTGSDTERNLVREQSIIEEIVERVLVMQANAAAQQHRPLGRGTYVKGSVPEPDSKYSTFQSVRTVVWRNVLRRGFSQRLAYIPQLCGLRMRIRI